MNRDERFDIVFTAMVFITGMIAIALIGYKFIDMLMAMGGCVK